MSFAVRRCAADGMDLRSRRRYAPGAVTVSGRSAGCFPVSEGITRPGGVGMRVRRKGHRFGGAPPAVTPSSGSGAAGGPRNGRRWDRGAGADGATGRVVPMG
ncbi:Hypothetical protein SCLAV_1653 [Streptomyces clavuligerus]|uniref:Uncharacterized protein n=1 Tax=Streptomyces clavuligerus TaxID=1901 RepID=E2Q2X5_STRCL|nr:Hypothetical protein SCLAV_1653 [Streptomyces clavuligerus]